MGGPSRLLMPRRPHTSLRFPFVAKRHKNQQGIHLNQHISWPKEEFFSCPRIRNLLGFSSVWISSHICYRFIFFMLIISGAYLCMCMNERYGGVAASTPQVITAVPTAKNTYPKVTNLRLRKVSISVLVCRCPQNWLKKREVDRHWSTDRSSQPTGCTIKIKVF